MSDLKFFYVESVAKLNAAPVLGLVAARPAAGLTGRQFENLTARASSPAMAVQAFVKKIAFFPTKKVSFLKKKYFLHQFSFEKDKEVYE
jgi:hypothetical protein